MIQAILKHANRLFGAGLLRNMVSLYGVQIGNYAFPLFVIPYTARILKPEAWGALALAQGLAAYLTLVVEYGFDLSASREVARHAGNAKQQSSLLASVCLAKLLMVGVAVVLVIAARPLLPQPLQDRPALVWSAMVFGASGGLSMVWYYQGVQRLTLISIADVLAKVVGGIAIFLLVRNPADDWKVLMIQGMLGLIVAAVGLLHAYREVPVIRPRWADIDAAFRAGWSMFTFRSSSMLILSGNTLLLGFLIPIQRVGFYAAAEKIVRSLCGLLYPFCRALYPRLSRMRFDNSPDADDLARSSTLAMFGIGLAMGAVVWLSAPLAVRLIMGPKFAEAASTLRLLSLVCPMVAVSMALAFQWLLPMGLERPFAKIAFVSGLVNLGTTALLAPLLSERAGALGVIAAEACVLISVLILMRKMSITTNSRFLVPVAGEEVL